MSRLRRLARSPSPRRAPPLAIGHRDQREDRRRGPVDASEPKRDNRSRRVRTVRDGVREREEGAEGAREGREPKVGPTCQRERKVDAPEEHGGRARERYPSVIQCDQHSYRYVAFIGHARNQRPRTSFSGTLQAIPVRRGTIRRRAIPSTDLLDNCPRTILCPATSAA